MKSVNLQEDSKQQKLEEQPRIARQETTIIRYKLTKNYNRTNTTVDRKQDQERNVEFANEVELFDGKGEGTQQEIDFFTKQQQDSTRKLKLQGVMKPEVASALDLKTHFKAFDYREAQM